MHLRLLALFALALAVTACQDPPPRCAVRGATFRICSRDAVWECPVGEPDDVAFNLRLDAECDDVPDPRQCAPASSYRMVEMTLVSDCAAAGQVCVDDPFAMPRTGTCADE